MAIYLVTFKDFDADYSSGLAVVQINAENPNNIVRDARFVQANIVPGQIGTILALAKIVPKTAPLAQGFPL